MFSGIQTYFFNSNDFFSPPSPPTPPQNKLTLMFYLSCPSAPLTINLRQCQYHHCHHQCYISVVIVFASAIINLNIWYTEPGQGLEFLDTPCIGQPEKDDSLISEQRHHWRQDPSTHPDNVLPWSTTAAGAVEPDQTNLIFSLTFGTTVCGILAWALRVRYTGRYGRIPPVTPIIRKERISTFFNDYFHFYGERG